MIASLLTFKAALAALLASNLVFIALWRRAAVAEIALKRSVAIAHRAYRDETKHLSHVGHGLGESFEPLVNQKLLLNKCLAAL